MISLYKELKRVLELAEMPGWLLLGYYLVQLLFARQKADSTSIDGSAIIFAGYALGAGLLSLRDLKRDEFGQLYYKVLFHKTCILWFVLYTLLCAISSLWSPHFVLTAYRSVECIGLLLVNAATIKNLLKNCDSDGIMLWSFSYAFTMLLMIFLDGILKHTLGTTLYVCQFPATIFFYLAFYYAPRLILKVPILLIALLCKSTTGYIGMAVGLVSLMFGKAKYRLLGIGVAVLIVAAVSSIGIEGVLNNTVFLTKKGVLNNGEFDVSKSSGRTILWERAINAVARENRQWYGYGFVVGETSFAKRVIGNQVIGLHNGLLSAYVGTGYIGLFIFVLFLLGYMKIPFEKSIPKQYKMVLIATMCCVFFHTIANPGLGFRVYGTWMPAMYIIMLTIGFQIKYKYLQSYRPPYRIEIDNKKRMLVCENY